MKKQRIIGLLATFILAITLLTALASCAKPNNTPATSGDEELKAVYLLYVSDAEEAGETPLSYEDWLNSIRGKDGKDGKDGVTPTIEISDDSYWVINGVKTEYKAIGTDGKDGQNGANGTNGTNGVDGKTPTIEISNDGYWVINGVKTEYKAIGTDGKDGQNGVNGTNGTNGVDGKTPTIEISNDGYWVINGVKTEHLATVTCNHIWQTTTTKPTCAAEGYDTVFCPLCDKSAIVNKTEKLEHTYNDTYSFDDNYHWFGCTGCDAAKDKEFHTPDDDGMCTVCDIPVSATPGVMYDISADGTYAEVIGYDGTASKVKIASEYKGLPVKEIYSEAFYCNDIITVVIIPDSVTNIGDGAFCDCQSLKSVAIGNGVTNIGEDAFYDCNSLLSIVIPDSVTNIGSGAFLGCTELKSVTIGNGVTRIGYHAFAHCYNLSTIIIPDSVMHVGEDAFWECSSLPFTEYEYGKYLSVNGNPYAILLEITNKKLSTYTIHEDTKIICAYVFYECERLTSITIPDSVTHICDGAFADCTLLTSIYFEGTVAEWNAIKLESNWNVNVPATEVICSDGTVEL